MSGISKVFFELHAPIPGAAPEAATLNLEEVQPYWNHERALRLAERLFSDRDEVETVHCSPGDHSYIVRPRAPYVWTGPLRASHRVFFFAYV